MRKGMFVDMLEKNLQKEIFKKYGALPWLRIWRNNTGSAVGLSLVMKAKRTGYFPDYLPVTKYGSPGCPDILGLIAPYGRFIGIETKAPTGKQTEEQKTWQKIITQLGGLYILAKSIEDVDKVLLDFAPDFWYNICMVGSIQNQ